MALPSTVESNWKSIAPSGLTATRELTTRQVPGLAWLRWRRAFGVGDVITIGNTDLTFTGGTNLAVRKATEATGAVQAHQLGLAIDGHQLMINVSFTARPGTLTSVIGPSGTGKYTLIKLLGATQPTSGQVTGDGHTSSSSAPTKPKHFVSQ